MTKYADIRDRLKEYQVKHGLKLHQLAHQLDTTEATVSRWVNKRHNVSRAWQELLKAKLGI